MTSNNRYRETVTKYLLKELDSKEELELEEWLKGSRANQEYLEKIRKTLALSALKNTAGKIDVEQQWSDFKQALTLIKTSGYTDPEPFEEDVPGSLDTRGKLSKFHIRASVAVAASILLALGLWWVLFNTKRQVDLTVTGSGNKSQEKGPESVLRHETNESAATKSIALMDGSVMMLERKTTISFMEPFQGNQRNITLTGKAYFKVAKDKTRPFIVWSGDISTTVLGTRFIVSAYPADRRIIVRLLEGRVMIKNGDTLQPKLKKNFYLLPGQEFVYDKTNTTGKITGFNRGGNMDDSGMKSDGIAEDDPVIPLNAKTSWYMFNNQKLSDVFEQFKIIYHADIEYNKKDMQNMYFIGKFNKSDSLNIILKQICTLNNLTLIIKENKYMISK